MQQAGRTNVDGRVVMPERRCAGIETSGRHASS